MTKDDVLAILINSDGYISGETISSRIGVTRAAVNGAVKALKSDGCIITSVTNRGYKLEYCPDKLFAGEVYSYLDEQRRSSVICVASTDSTNNLLKEMLKDSPVSGTCIIANEQTGGRGRMGRTFISPPDTGIYMSMILRPEGSFTDMSEITAWTAVAVHNAILSAYGINTDIKWVNDLFLGGKKTTGILTELSIEGEIGVVSNVIVGIGINVNQSRDSFPEELRDIATSLSAGSGTAKLNRARLAAEVIKELDRMMTLWPSGKEQYLETYRNCCLTIGKDVDVINYSTGVSRPGRALDINPDFSLKVIFEDGHTEDVRSGEVSVRRR